MKVSHLGAVTLFQIRSVLKHLPYGFPAATVEECEISEAHLVVS
jgi:hypothetical protein